MEKKTKQRILGALIVVGFIIIMLPFFQSTKDVPGESTVVKAPPFPDQAVQVSETPSDATPQGQVNPQVNDMMGVKQEPPATNNPDSTKTDNHANTNNSDDNDKNDETLSPPTELTTSDDNKELSDANNVDKSNATKKDAADAKPAKISLKQNKALNTVASRIAAQDKNGLAKIREAVWVIQIGSFKNKANALRLVNQLRANGYKAFIQQVSTSLGSSTRVFVGPETKHASARAIVKKLRTQMQINGIVISYKPLTL